MIFEVHTTKPMEAIAQGLEQAAARHKFGILVVHDLQQTLRNKGVEMEREVRIFEVCNPHQAKKAIEADPRISTALPCRISVFRSGDGYTLATLLPTEMMKGFGAPAMDRTAREVEDVLTAMMREAAG